VGIIESCAGGDEDFAESVGVHLPGCVATGGIEPFFGERFIAAELTANGGPKPGLRFVA
jgi:hypothetical protein